ncbi:aldo/keto reductase [Salinispira pacifica]
MYTLTEKRTLGRTGFSVPPVIFGTSAFGNLYRVLTREEKKAIAVEWFRNVEPPVVLDTAGKYGAGLALESIGDILRELDIDPEDVIISNKLGWKRVPLTEPEPTFERGVWMGIEHDAEQSISYDGILECFRQGCELLGEPFRPKLVSVHDPDEYLAAATDGADRKRRLDDIRGAYRALSELKAAGEVSAVGVGAKEWQVIRELHATVPLDWVMFACSLTVHRHSRELLDFVEGLRVAGVGIVNSAVFNAGFLIGGEYYDYAKPDPVRDAELFRWRDSFLSICSMHKVKPVDACVEFGLSAPGVAAVALNTSRAGHIPANIDSVTTKAPPEFWRELKRSGLVAADYEHLG